MRCDSSEFSLAHEHLGSLPNHALISGAFSNWLAACRCPLSLSLFCLLSEGGQHRSDLQNFTKDISPATPKLLLCNPMLNLMAMWMGNWSNLILVGCDQPKAGVLDHHL